MIQKTLDEQMKEWRRQLFWYVKEYREKIGIVLKEADHEDLVGEVLLKVLNDVRAGREDVNELYLRCRTIDVLKSDTRRQEKVRSFFRGAEESTRGHNGWKSYAYWNGMGSSDADWVSQKLGLATLFLPPEIGAVARVAISSGAKLNEEQNRARVGSALGYSVETVRKYARTAASKLKKIEAMSDLEWKEINEQVKVAREQDPLLGCMEVIVARLAQLEGRDQGDGDEDLLMLHRAIGFSGDAVRQLSLLATKVRADGVVEVDGDRLMEMIAVVISSEYWDEAQKSEACELVLRVICGEGDAWWLAYIERMRHPREDAISLEKYRVWKEVRDLAISYGMIGRWRLKL